MEATLLHVVLYKDNFLLCLQLLLLLLPIYLIFLIFIGIWSLAWTCFPSVVGFVAKLESVYHHQKLDYEIVIHGSLSIPHKFLMQYLVFLAIILTHDCTLSDPSYCVVHVSVLSPEIHYMIPRYELVINVYIQNII